MELETLENEVLNLNPIDKIRLVEMVFDSLDKPDNDIEQLWVTESEERYHAFKEGKLKGTALAEVKKRICYYPALVFPGC